jgi:hypothetical protein
MYSALRACKAIVFRSRRQPRSTVAITFLWDVVSTRVAHPSWVHLGGTYCSDGTRPLPCEVLVSGAKDCSWLTSKSPVSRRAAVMSTIVVCNSYFKRMRAPIMGCCRTSLQVGAVTGEIKIEFRVRWVLALLSEITTVSAEYSG